MGNLDGVLDELSSKNMTDFGPIDDHANDSEDETTYNAIRLPGAKRGDDGSRSTKEEVLTRQVAFSSTGREWSAISGEGLHVYSLDEDMLFDPISLTEAITPAAVEIKLLNKDYSMALRMSIHLNEYKLMKQVLEEIPYGSVPSVVKTISSEQLERLMNTIAKIMDTSPHVQYYLRWCLEKLKTICNQNKYTLDFIESHAQLAAATSAASLVSASTPSGSSTKAAEVN